VASFGGMGKPCGQSLQKCWSHNGTTTNGEGTLEKSASINVTIQSAHRMTSLSLTSGWLEVGARLMMWQGFRRIVDDLFCAAAEQSTQLVLPADSLEVKKR
jgi:hypothetical protein